MDNASDENLRKNLWQHQQHSNGDANQQFYASQYQVGNFLVIPVPRDV